MCTLTHLNMCGVISHLTSKCDVSRIEKMVCMLHEYPHFRHFMDLFACVPFNSRTSTWMTFLNLKHVLLMAMASIGGDVISARSVYGVCFFTWRNLEYILWIDGVLSPVNSLVQGSGLTYTLLVANRASMIVDTLEVLA